MVEEDNEKMILAGAVAAMVAGGIIGYVVGPAYISEDIEPMAYALGGVMIVGVGGALIVSTKYPISVPH